jgi:hypothetical protein
MRRPVGIGAQSSIRGREVQLEPPPIVCATPPGSPPRACPPVSSATNNKRYVHTGMYGGLLASGLWMSPLPSVHLGVLAAVLRRPIWTSKSLNVASSATLSLSALCALCLSVLLNVLLAVVLY